MIKKSKKNIPLKKMFSQKLKKYPKYNSTDKNEDNFKGNSMSNFYYYLQSCQQGLSFLLKKYNIPKKEYLEIEKHVSTYICHIHVSMQDSIERYMTIPFVEFLKANELDEITYNKYLSLDGKGNKTIISKMTLKEKKRRELWYKGSDWGDFKYYKYDEMYNLKPVKKTLILKNNARRGKIIGS